ncbi:MAG: DUF2939 domain-containing protein [Nitrosomonadaceae bacterium]|nr:DUF2939 domain-containing protein [Nitrosomonadaceae bacterium]
MKAKLYTPILILALIATYSASAPHHTITEIKLAIINQDPEKLSEYIDFPILRQNLKNQENSIVDFNAAELNSTPSALFAAGIITAIFEKQVDSLITPYELASILETRLKSENHKRDSNESIDKDRLFQNATLHFKSIDTYLALAPYGINKELKLILQRNTLTWKLVNIIFSDQNSIN